MATFRFDLCELPAETRALREEVRDFLRTELGDRAPVRRAQSWGGFDREFSRKVGARGWIGMTGGKLDGGDKGSGVGGDGGLAVMRDVVWSRAAHRVDH